MLVKEMNKFIEEKMEEAFKEIIFGRCDSYEEIIDDLEFDNYEQLVDEVNSMYCNYLGFKEIVELWNDFIKRNGEDICNEIAMRIEDEEELQQQIEKFFNKILEEVGNDYALAVETIENNNSEILKREFPNENDIEKYWDLFQYGE